MIFATLTGHPGTGELPYSRDQAGTDRHTGGRPLLLQDQDGGSSLSSQGQQAKTYCPQPYPFLKSQKLAALREKKKKNPENLSQYNFVQACLVA